MLPFSRLLANRSVVSEPLIVSQMRLKCHLEASDIGLNPLLIV